MKVLKKAFVAALIAVFVLTMTGNAMAAGWWKENASDTINVLAGNGAETADGLWSLQTGNTDQTSPHGNFSTSTNKCKTCHAVHGARETSFRLLRNESRQDECNFCHWKAAGASKYRLYAYSDLGYTVRGEHTLGATIVPDSNLARGNPAATSGDATYNVPDRGTYDSWGNPSLFCFSCHSVHGAGTLEAADGSEQEAAAGWWTQRILRRNPGNFAGAYNALNGLDAVNVGLLGYSTTTSQDVQGGGTSTIPAWADQSPETRRNMVRAAFCAGCHTKNFNYRENEDNGQDYSLQKGSHPMNTDGMLEVGGGAGVSGLAKVSWTPANWCGSCHAAPIELGGSATSDTAASALNSATGFSGYAGATGPDQENTADALNMWDWGNETWYAAGFPHQSESNKLLFDDVRNTSGGSSATVAGVSNDAYRAIDGMDKVCAKCHTDNGTFDTNTISGPSKSF